MHSFRPPTIPKKTILLFFLALLFPVSGFSHVKWFSGFSFLDEPLSIPEVANPLFVVLVALSMFVISMLVFADKKIMDLSWYRKINIWLTDQAKYSVIVIRVAMAAVLLISWANGTILTPELQSQYDWFTWLQFIIALLLLFPKLTTYAGAGIILIYLIAVFEFGVFHMLDYMHFPGIGFYLFVQRLSNEKIQGFGLPALYITIGFSLIWLGYEKLFYPNWGLYLLEQNPQLTFGLPHEFFLQAAAFVEISLGYLLIIGLLERPLAAVITVVFFLTTLVFGKLEVIGHTPLHAALIVFLFNGTGSMYKPPIAIHKNTLLRLGFAAVNFAIVAAFFLVTYSFSAERQYEIAWADAQTDKGTAHGTKILDLSGQENLPSITNIEAIQENDGSYILHIEVENWEFTPEKSGNKTELNEGHAHVYINGSKAGRMYSNWFHLGELTPGKHRLNVTLNGNDHTEFVVDGKIISAEETLVVQ